MYLRIALIILSVSPSIGLACDGDCTRSPALEILPAASPALANPDQDRRVASGAFAPKRGPALAPVQPEGSAELSRIGE